MISFKNIKWKDFKFFDVVKGCASSWLIDIKGAPEFVAKTSKYRLSICEDCHMNVNWWCDNSGERFIEDEETKEMVIGCGCNLKCKTALLSQECPARKWRAVTQAPVQSF
jgi:hypothetical protein